MIDTTMLLFTTDNPLFMTRKAFLRNTKDKATRKDVYKMDIYKIGVITQSTNGHLEPLQNFYHNLPRLLT